MFLCVRTLFTLVAFGGVLLCGCQRQADPQAEVVPPAVVIQPAVPSVPAVVEVAPEPHLFRPKYGHVKSIFFLTSVNPEEDALSYGLTYRDLEGIQALPGVAELIPVRFVRAEVHSTDHVVKTRIAATIAGYADTYSMKLSAGRFLTAADNDEMENVCVLKPWVAKHLFQNEDPLGQPVNTRGHVFRVVGVLAQDTDENDPGVYIPIKTARRRFGDVIRVPAAEGWVNEKVELHEIIVRASDPDKRETLAGLVSKLLDKAHPKKDWQLLWPGEPRED